MRSCKRKSCLMHRIATIAGYDALGFISCTGTNFMVRAAALKEVGGSPTYTLTEDFALGMALKMYGWHCRYVQVRATAAATPPGFFSLSGLPARPGSC